MAPIHEAAKNGNLEVVKRLIRQDPQVVHKVVVYNHGYEDHGSTPLHYACEGGHTGVAAYLLSHGARINQQDYWGRTACYLACREGRLPVVELLSRKGADPAIPTTSGNTPLMVASDRGHVGVLDRLLHYPQALATLDLRDDWRGQTCLWFACCKGHGGVVRRLLQAGANPTIANTNGRSPMAISRQGRREECVMLLEVRVEQEAMMV